MSPRKPLSAAAIEILGILHRVDMPMDLLGLRVRLSKTLEAPAIEAALEELAARGDAELRPRVSPPHWQIAGA